MSTFSVDQLTIETIEPHPNADKLEIVSIGGYRAVVQKGIHKVGDTIVYIPTGAIVPNDVAVALDIDGYLVGKLKNRVKALKLRGILSEGIVIPHLVANNVAMTLPSLPRMTDQPWAEALGITKYEEPIPVNMSGKIRPWPSMHHHYDVENLKCAKWQSIFRPGEDVVLTEKLHGAQISIFYSRDEEFSVCSHRCSIIEDDSNLYWQVVKLYGLLDKLKELRRLILVNQATAELALYGEVLGCQDLKYGFTMADPGFVAFDLFLNGEPLSYDALVYWMNAVQIPIVPPAAPVLSWGLFDPKDFAEQDSVYGGIREGVVIRPLKERTDPLLGRVQLKYVSERYLTRKEGTELH